MCGRFNLTAVPEQVIDVFKLHRLPRYEVSYNIPPGQKILTVVQLDDGSYKSVYLYWGLIPHWAKDRNIGHHLINARAETIAESVAFKSAYQQRRCLIPATGFYEWQKTEQGKQAYCISRLDRRLFAFAGIWEYWEHEAETVYSCTIITIEANDIISPIHQRMPVIVDYKNYPLWLDKNTSLKSMRQLLFDDEGYRSMRLKPVSDWVNNPYHNDKNCLN